MFAVTAARIDAENPLAGLELGDRPEPVPPDGWTTVTVRAAALNHHDVWTLRGVGISADRLPIVLGCDAAGTDPDGNVLQPQAPPGGDEVQLRSAEAEIQRLQREIDALRRSWTWRVGRMLTRPWGVGRR